MKIGRNNPCPCGSGKKYKNCCLKKAIVNIPVIIPTKIPKISIAAFKNMQGFLCSCGEIYIRARSAGDWKYYFIANDYMPDAIKVANKPLYLVPVQYIHHPHKLLFSDMPENLLT